MGIIKAIRTATDGVLADQWKEMIWCDPFVNDELIKPGNRRTGAKTSNKKGSADVISNGSIVVVGETECAIAVENGRMIGVYAEAGNNHWKSKRSASVFAGDSVASLASNIWERVGFGGDIPIVQKVYYVSTREIVNQPFECNGSIPLRIINDNLSLDIDLKLMVSGRYSFKIADPAKFYKNVAGNRAGAMHASALTSQMQSEVYIFLNETLSKINADGIRPYELAGHVDEVAETLKDTLTEKWLENRGIQVLALGIDGMTLMANDFAIVKTLEANAVLTDPEMAAATLAAAQAEAMQVAAENKGGAGAVAAFAAMNMTSGSTMTVALEENKKEKKDETGSSES